MGDYSTVYSKNTSFAIKEYLEKNIYPEKITSLDYQKQQKKEFKRNCKKNKGLDYINQMRIKNIQCFIKIGIKKKKLSKIDMKGDQEVHHQNNDSGIEDLYIIPEVLKAQEIIYGAHTKHDSHLKVESKYKKY